MVWFGIKAIIYPVPVNANVEIVAIMQINTSYREYYDSALSKSWPAGNIYTGNHKYEADAPTITAPATAPGLNKATVYKFRYWEGPSGKITNSALNITVDGDYWANYQLTPLSGRRKSATGA